MTTPTQTAPAIPHDLQDPDLATVRATLKGKKLEKFETSLACLLDSAAAGGWLPKASQKAMSGFAGIVTYRSVRHIGFNHPAYEAARVLQSGGDCGPLAEAITDDQLREVAPKVAPLAARAWLRVCRAATRLNRMLDKTRPLPKITDIGLSPRVTATLQECGLDVDLQSIKPTKIGCRWFHGRYPQTVVSEVYDSETRRYRKAEKPHPQAGELMYDRHGEPVMLPSYYLDWTPGTQKGLSRFAHADCEACGKRIPSGRFVAVEADCRKHGHIGLYLGCDCASNIFGVKDAGLQGKG